MADWRTVDEWTEESEPYRVVEREGMFLLEAHDDGKWWRMITASGIHVLARRLASLLEERGAMATLAEKTAGVVADFVMVERPELSAADVAGVVAILIQRRIEDDPEIELSAVKAAALRWAPAERPEEGA